MFTRHSWLFFFFVQSFYIILWAFFVKKETKKKPYKKKKQNFLFAFFFVFPLILYTSFILYDFFFSFSLYSSQHFCLLCHCHFILLVGSILACFFSFCCCFRCPLFNLFVILSFFFFLFLIFDYIFCLFIFYRIIIIQAVKIKENIACERAHLSGVVALFMFCTFK